MKFGQLTIETAFDIEIKNLEPFWIWYKTWKFFQVHQCKFFWSSMKKEVFWSMPKNEIFESSLKK